MAEVLLYCSIDQLHALGLNADALSQFTETEKTAAIKAASKRMDSYLRDRFVLPLQDNGTPGETGEDLAECCAVVAVYTLLSSRGYNPRDPGEDVPRLRYEDMLRWLKAIADGTVTPDCTDSSSGAQEGIAPTRPKITSNRSRGWETKPTGTAFPFTGKK